MNSRSHNPRPRRAGRPRPRYAYYEQLKAQFMANNPGATPEEYERAMRQFAKMAGV